MRDKGIYQVPFGLEVPPTIGVSAHKASVCKEVVIWSCGANPMTSSKGWKGGEKEEIGTAKKYSACNTLPFMDAGTAPHPQGAMPRRHGQHSKAASWQLTFARKVKLTN